MCGIAGIFYFDNSKKVEIESLKKMTDSIVHRGPDDEGFYCNQNIGLGFRRLSIIDLKTGHQPMTNEDETLWIVFNGEIYNFLSLRDSLKKQGHIFKTNTDTETIVHLYEQYGKDCVKYLRGMFAFAIWDSKKNELYCARDRFGIKPLFYYYDSEKFIFASEIKEILTIDGLDKKIDVQALDSYFTYGYITSDLSIFQNIKKVSPSHYLIINPNGKPIFNRYWDIVFNPDYSKSENYWSDEIEKLLDETVKIHMISDVSLGAFLSGGIDSSSVVAFMNKNSNQPIKTFSIGFKEEKYNELEYAREIAKLYKTDHHEMIVEPESVNLIPKIVSAFDEPFSDASALPTYFVSKFAREKVTVALSGDGGDELFTGYNSYSKFNKIHKYSTGSSAFNKLFWGTINKVLPDHVFGKGLTYYLAQNREHISAFSCKWQKHERFKLFQDVIIKELRNCSSEQYKIDLLNSSNVNDFVTRLQELDMRTYMVDDILTKVDRMSMLNSLEVRVPILDHVFAELSFRIPLDIKFKQQQKKYILKKAVQSYLPSGVISHKKQGFAVPLKLWFKDDLNTYISDKLLNSNSSIYNYLNPNYIKKTINDHFKGQRDFSNKLWTLIIFEEWIDSIK